MLLTVTPLYAILHNNRTIMHVYYPQSCHKTSRLKSLRIVKLTDVAVYYSYIDRCHKQVTSFPSQFPTEDRHWHTKDCKKTILKNQMKRLVVI